MSEMYEECEEILSPLIKSASKHDGVIRMKNRGRIDFWTLNNPKCGRSRKYHEVGIDEAAHTDADMMDLWQKNIRPTLLDYRGEAIVGSTPAGINEENFFWRICNQPEHGFKEFYAPTHSNPLLPREEVARLQEENMPAVYAQEFMAQWVDWNGVAFFPLDHLLVDGKPVPMPERTGQIYCVIDTALKDGWQHDGTAVAFFAREKYSQPRLIVLDWDIVQIEGASLELWLPSVYERMSQLANMCRAREGVIGAFIEDKASGIVLIQQAKKKGLRVHSLPSAMTALGKEGRALSVSSYFHRGEIKLSQYAFDKVVKFKGVQKNHFIAQLCGFRMGDTDAKRADDLADCGMYGAAIGCGDSRGY